MGIGARKVGGGNLSGREWGWILEDAGRGWGIWGTPERDGGRWGAPERDGGRWGTPGRVWVLLGETGKPTSSTSKT